MYSETYPLVSYGRLLNEILYILLEHVKFFVSFRTEPWNNCIQCCELTCKSDVFEWDSKKGLQTARATVSFCQCCGMVLPSLICLSVLPMPPHNTNSDPAIVLEKGTV